MLRTYLSDPKNGLIKIKPLPLLIDASIIVVGIIPGNYLFYIYIYIFIYF